MKKFLLLLIFNSHPIAIGFLSFNSFSQSPDWLWAKAMGGANIDVGNSIAVDPAGNGNVYTTGKFQGTVDFDPGPGVFILTGYSGFITKLDGLGNFIWAKAIGGSSNSIAIDPAGNGDVYTTGRFWGTVDFDPDTSVGNVFNLTSAGNTDIFISKLDGSGNFVWAKQIGGTGYAEGLSIAIDPAGSGGVYTTGEFEGTADFDPGAGVFNLTSAGNEDIFISKLDSSGNFVWAKAMSGTGNDNGNSIAIDPAGIGDVYTTGWFGGTVDFDPGANVFNLTSSFGSADIFISKLDSSGNFIWAKRMGAISVDGGYSIAIDPAGSGGVYTTGYFIGSVDFDPGAGVFNLTSVGAQDIFISKLDSLGNFVWTKQMSGISVDFGSSIAIDPAGSGAVYTTGQFNDTADFDPGPGVFNLTGGGGFISKLDSSGNFVWAKSAGGTSYPFRPSIALNTSGNVYVTSSFDSPSLTLGSTTLTNAGSHDIFIAKLDTAVVTGINALENFDSGVSIYPNPFSNSTSISFSLSQSQKVSIKIFDLNGSLVATLADKYFEVGAHQIEFNAEKLDAGIYFLKMQAGEILKTEKLIITN